MRSFASDGTGTPLVLPPTLMCLLPYSRLFHHSIGLAKAVGVCTTDFLVISHLFPTFTAQIQSMRAHPIGDEKKRTEVYSPRAQKGGTSQRLIEACMLRVGENKTRARFRAIRGILVLKIFREGALVTDPCREGKVISKRCPRSAKTMGWATSSRLSFVMAFWRGISHQILTFETRLHWDNTWMIGNLAIWSTCTGA